MWIYITAGMGKRRMIDVWPPNIVGAYFLAASLGGVMLGMAVHSLITGMKDWFRCSRRTQEIKNKKG